jgi:predicted RNase H-related nuclease YkuK (DUF458 family)
MNKTWTSGSDILLSYNEMLEEIQKYSPEEIFIGCDSQPKKDEIVFVEAVCVLRKSLGARFWTRKRRVSKKNLPVLGLRLIKEVTLACSIAIKLREKVDAKITIHADISPNEQNKSNKVAEQAVSYIKGLQFNYAIKPNAWASCTVADRRTK